MRFTQYTAASILAASTVMATPVAPTCSCTTTPTDCAPIHLLVARGSTESPGDGQLGSLATKIIQVNQGATQEAIDYPANLSPYGPSVSTGTKAVQAQLATYVAEGAQIIGDALCGGDAAGSGPVTPPMSATISAHVDAIVWYGDPRNVAGKSFDMGTATTSGIYARPASQSCDSFASVIASDCDVGDLYCARGNNVNVHLTYPQRHDTAAATFVNQKVA